MLFLLHYIIIVLILLLPSLLLSILAKAFQEASWRPFGGEFGRTQPLLLPVILTVFVDLLLNEGDLEALG